MRTTNLLAALVLLPLTAAISGCQTYGESASLGGIIGAAAGAVIGHQSGHAGEGAAIGAAVGAATGAIVHDQQEQRERAYEDSIAVHEPAAESRPRPHSGGAGDETLLLELVSVTPETVRRGELVEVSIQYAVLDTADGVRVKESCTLSRRGEEVELFSSRMIYRSNGSWVSPQTFRISDRLEPGEYTIVQSVESRNARISGVSNVTVR